MARLWNIIDGEPWLDNPEVFLLNAARKKGRRIMARRRRDGRGRFVSSARPRTKTRRRRRKQSMIWRKPTTVFARPRAVAIMNPRRRYRRNDPDPGHRRRRRWRTYRRNPGIASTFGLDMPTLKAVGFTVLGVGGTPFVEGLVGQVLPASITTNKIGSYAVKIASVLGLSWGVRQVAGKQAGTQVAIGGFAYVTVSALKDFAPSLFPSTSPAISGVGAQPLLGMGMYPSVGMGSYITSNVPDRLRPENRF